MKRVRGVYLPNADVHMAAEISATPVVGGFPTYQYRKLEAAMAYVPERRTAIDVGAHVGLWSAQLARLFDRVVAFEPVPLHAECLRKNLAGFGHVALERCALGTRQGHAIMRQCWDNSGASYVGCEAMRSGLRVELRRLDDFHFDGIDFLKLDCEGYEYFALCGARATIERCRPVVVVEQHEESELRYGVPHLAGRDLLVRLGYAEVEQVTVDHIMVPQELLG